jgi:hypothetical protein
VEIGDKADICPIKVSLSLDSVRPLSEAESLLGESLGKAKKDVRSAPR